MDFSVEISRTTKGKPPRLPFTEMKNEVLGKNYLLSVAFVGDKRSRTLNKQYRKKDKPANILSFALSDAEGEIVMNLAQCKRDAKKFNRTFDNFVAFLFIHGLFHLKGFEHGSRMEEREKSVRKHFGI